MPTRTEIEELSRRIVREFQPERIILFGSHAYGSPGTDSDVDLLVVMKYAGKAHHKAAEILDRARTRFPIDVLVRSPEELRHRIALGDLFVTEIVERGKVLYEAERR